MKTINKILILLLFTFSAFGVWEFGDTLKRTFQDFAIFKVLSAGQPGASDSGTVRVYFNDSEEPRYINSSGDTFPLGGGSAGTVKIVHQEKFETSVKASSFSCGANFSVSDETVNPMAGNNSLDFDQGVTPATGGTLCSGPSISLDPKAQGKRLEVCFNSKYNGEDGELRLDVVPDNGETLSIPINKSPARVSVPASIDDYRALEHCGYITLSDSVTSLDIDPIVVTGNDNTTFRIDDLEFRIDPLYPSEIFASTDTTAYSPGVNNAVNLSTNDGWYYRKGEYLHVHNFHAWNGNSSGSTFVVNLPSGLEIDTSKTDCFSEDTSFGSGQFLDNGTSRRTVSVSCNTSSPSTILFKLDNGGGSVISGSIQAGDRLSYNYKVPIIGWTNTNRGIAIKGSVQRDLLNTNNFTAKVASNGDVSRENLDWISVSNVRNTTGLYQISVNPALNLTSTLNCFPKINSPSSFGEISDCDLDEALTTSSTITVRCHSDGGTGAAQDRPFTISCQKNLDDFVKEHERTTVFSNGLSPKKCYLKEIQALGVGTTTSLSASSFVKSTLNSTNGDCGFLNLSSSGIGLADGEYDVSCKQPFFINDTTNEYNLKSRFRNVTDGTTPEFLESTGYTVRGSGVSVGHIDVSEMEFSGRLKVSGYKVFELQVRTDNTFSLSAGRISNSGSFESYASCTIAKVN